MDEDTIDEILYLARVNEVNELSTYLSDVSAQAKRSKAELVAAAVDAYSKNTALHYAAANGHVGMSIPAVHILNVSASYMLTADRRHGETSLLS